MTAHPSIPYIEVNPFSDELLWIHVDNVVPSHPETIWVMTKSGIVATGRFSNPWWYTDGHRVLDPYDTVTWWAEIDYPRGPR
jgi:hypothetical protein